MVGLIYLSVASKVLCFVAVLSPTPRNVRRCASVASPIESVAYAMAASGGPLVRLPDRPDESGIATVYGSPGDKYAQRGTACAPHDRINDVDHVCAHRRYRCGTVLIVENQSTGDRGWCVVMDRGPYGASVFAPDGSKVMISDRRAAWYIKVSDDHAPSDDLCPDGGCVGRWRGVLDMSPAVSRDIGHTGWGTVKVWKAEGAMDFHKRLFQRSAKHSI